MKLNGTVTTVKDVIVNVSASDAIREIIELWKKSIGLARVDAYIVKGDKLPFYVKADKLLGEVTFEVDKKYWVFDDEIWYGSHTSFETVLCRAEPVTEDEIATYNALTVIEKMVKFSRIEK